MQTTLGIYGHMIHGQDDEAVRKWEEYQQRNRPTGQGTTERAVEFLDASAPGLQLSIS